ncbi:MAG: ATP-binding cassette domain-containing protein [Bacilli bacterium]|nr:ATP-binding cassette domain-containing protein [Bacilli bacterium]
MRKYPFVKQTGLRDCGPACILMILKYFGGYMSLNKLSVLLSTNNKGTSIYNMLECLSNLGFKCDAYKYNDIAFIKCPCIAHVKYDNYNHFVVIYEVNYKKKYLIIGDPNKKIIKISFNEFLSIWSNIVIEMKPVCLIVKEEEPKVFDFILSIIKSNIFYLLFIGFISIIICFLSIFSTFFLQIVISYKNNFLILIIPFFLTLFFKSLLEYIRNKFLFKMNYKIDGFLSFDTFRKIINLPYASSKNKSSGELISYFNDLFVIKNLMSYLCIFLFVDFPLIILLSVVLVILCFKLYLFNFGILIFYLLIHFLFHKKKYYLSDEVLKRRALFNSFISESISGFETINNLNIKDKVLENFKNKYNCFVDVNKRLDFLKNKELFFKDAIFNVSLLLVLVYGFMSNDSNFISIYFLFSLLNSSFMQLLNFDENLFNVVFSIKHVQDLFFDLKKEICTSGNICLENVSKSFNGKLVLSDINLIITKGEKVFVGGQSGSGKSTLFKIVKGYYHYDGKCQIDGYESCDYNFSNILYVSEDEFLFTGRVLDNFFRGNNIINYKICELDKGNDDFILENGFNLSNGQRQRISLARALNNFEIIIIDEGLDGVDINMERRILKKIFSYYNDKTIIYISHRLDNLDLFDRFIKMESGRIVLDEVKNNQEGVIYEN